MCGVAGILAFERDAPFLHGDLIERMRDSMTHRGPDEAGVFRDSHIALGQRRLSIIDLAGGSQPMSDANQTVQVLNNGEIYNYQELRRDLEARGQAFRTDSDTEVIVNGYLEYGEAVVDHLRGMFAAAIWDASAQKLLLMRDRAGQKPLYYAHLPEGLFFASEIKALLEYSGLPRDLDVTALHDYFTYQSIPEPLSIFTSVRKLPPGHFLRCDTSGQLDIKQYWRWNLCEDRQTTLSYDEAVARTRDLLDEAVRLRMIADVPLGALLSGGVDSSAVVAMMARHASGPVKTFSIGFSTASYDERPYARQVAAFCGTDHEELMVEPENVRDILPRLATQYDEPFADVSALPTYYVCKMARRHVTVALAGDGGDEAFAGYERYAKFTRLSDVFVPGLQPLASGITALTPSGVQGRRTLRLLGTPFDARYQRMNTILEAPARQRLLTERFAGDARQLIMERFQAWGDLAALSKLQQADLEIYLPSTVLVKVDRASMLNSLEVRAPLLDHRLLEFVGTLPAAWQPGKRVLKDAIRGLVPDDILTRPKAGFGVPLEHWFGGDFGAFSREVLLDGTAQARGILNAPYVEKLIAQQQRPWMEHSGALWAILMFELWCRAYDI